MKHCAGWNLGPTMYSVCMYCTCTCSYCLHHYIQMLLLTWLHMSKLVSRIEELHGCASTLYSVIHVEFKLLIENTEIFHCVQRRWDMQALQQ